MTSEPDGHSTGKMEANRKKHEREWSTRVKEQ
jgi:hypothetical protein